MKTYYRISNNSYKKNRLPNATKEHCLDNFLKHFDVPENTICIVADNVTDKNLSAFIDTKLKNNIIRENTSLNNGQSFKYCMNRACAEAIDKEFIYFAEDDYLYINDSYTALVEGLQIAHYATLYDHPDKYLDAVDGGNPQIENGGEITRVVRTQHFHWKLTNSTTFTFGTNGKTLREDRLEFEKYTMSSYGRDYELFCELIHQKNRSLISCIPGKCTHSEVPWLTPFVDWTKV